MNTNPFKLSVAISVAIHGVVISGAVWYEKMPRRAALVPVASGPTLELVAAPAVAPAPAAPLEPPAIPTPAPPPPAPEPPEMVVPVDQDLDPDPTAFAPLPPAPTVETESKPTAPPTNSPEPWPTEPEPSAVTGDGSSPLPGQDVTTAPGALVTTASPDYRRNPEPEYPLPARRRGQEGLVVLEVTVSGVGQATAVALKQSSGYALLDQAAMQAVKHWEFEPARIGAVGVESRIEVPVRFRLSP